MIKSSKKINILIIIITILFFILFFTSANFEKNKMLQLYSSGKNKIENQQYQEAQEIFSKLGDYKDSLEQIEIAKILEQKKKKYAIMLLKNLTLKTIKIPLNYLSKLMNLRTAKNILITI